MVFNTDFALQIVRDHQAELVLGVSRLRVEPVQSRAIRERVGAWVIRVGQAIEGQAVARPSGALHA